MAGWLGKSLWWPQLGPLRRHPTSLSRGLDVFEFMRPTHDDVMI